MIDRRIKFRHIQCFVEIAREGSFKQAAAKLFLSQPAISKTLKELEEILSLRLLTRNRGGVQLTPDGETFLHYAESSIASLQQGMDSIGERGQSRLSSLSIGVMPSVAARLIPTVTSEVARVAPDLLLRIVDGPHGFLIDRLKLGELDLVIGRMGDHAQMRGIAFNALYRERISFVVRPGHPLLARPALQNILDWPLVYPPVGSAIRPIVDRFLIEQGIGDLPRRIETVSGAFGRVFVRQSDAVWVISDGVVANEIEQGQLARLPINTDTTLGPIGITTREDWDYSATAKTFRGVLRQSVAAMPEIAD